MNYVRLLVETANSPMYTYRIVQKGSYRMVWEFQTDEGVAITVTATQMQLDYDVATRGGAVRVDFESNISDFGTCLKTTTVLRIYKTILLGIVADVIRHSKPEVLYFVSSDMRRANIAYRFISQYESKGWNVQRTDRLITMTSDKASEVAKHAAKWAHIPPISFEQDRAFDLDRFRYDWNPEQST